MRPVPTLPFLFLCLTLACTQEQSRPAKEAVADAKAAAAEAKQGAATAAAEADRAVTGATRAVQEGVASAAGTARTDVDAVASNVRELGQGGVVTGRVSALSHSRLLLSAESKGPAELRVDDKTRYLLHGLERAPLPAGTRVRATYVVEAHVPVATEVEVLQ